jgi:hypothetical protein
VRPGIAPGRRPRPDRWPSAVRSGLLSSAADAKTRGRPAWVNSNLPRAPPAMRATPRRGRNLLRCLISQGETDAAAVAQRRTVPPRPCLLAIAGMRVLIVDVRPVNIIAFEIIACDIAPRAAGVILDMGVIVRCIYQCGFGVQVASECRTCVRREGKSH